GTRRLLFSNRGQSPKYSCTEPRLDRPRPSWIRAKSATRSPALTEIEGDPVYHRRCGEISCLNRSLPQAHPRDRVKAGTKWALPHFWCNPAADWRNPLESREPLCDRFAWGFSVCGDFFEASGWSF